MLPQFLLCLLFLKSFSSIKLGVCLTKILKNIVILNGGEGSCTLGFKILHYRSG